MRWLPVSKLSPIGLDLGSHSFKAVQLKKSSGGWDVATAATLARVVPGSPLEAAEIVRLDRVLERRGFVGRDVIIGIPAANYITAILELPARLPGVPIEQIATVEFARVHKHDASALTMSTWELPSPARASKTTYMLAVGAVSAQLETHIDLVESDHLNVVAVEDPYSAAARACLHGADAEIPMLAVIDLGWDAARLAIVKMGSVIYTRKLSDGGLARLYAAALEALPGEAEAVEHDLWRVGFSGSSQPDLDRAEVLDLLESHMTAVLREVNRAFAYTSHQYPDAVMSTVVLIGGGAAIPGISSRFQTTLGVTTSVGVTSRKVLAGDESSAGMMSALGLALWSEGTR